jgi:two-component system response regulator TctD
VVLHLTPREHAALTGLIGRAGLPMEKQQLFCRVFEQDSETSLDAIEVVLHRLRKKLAGSDVRIVTVRGLGYMLEAIEPGL